MGFILVRVDATEPCKVTLPAGSHFIGRGKFLDCNDHRVSRKHAELTVTSDSIVLKSLHQNPCFFKKKSSKETIIFCQPDFHILRNGDQFGLIPDSYWYEVIDCSERDNGTTEEEMEENTEPYVNKEQEKINYCIDSVVNETGESPSIIPPENPSPTKEADDACEIPMADHPEDMDKTSTDKPNESGDQLNESTDQPNESTHQPNRIMNQSDATIYESDESTDGSTVQAGNASKRSHSHEGSPCDIKKVKMEPEDGTNKDPIQSEDGVNIANQPIKTERGSPQDAKPGPSNNDQGGSNGSNNNAPPSPAKPPNKPLRERCMYGAQCYRRNMQHKSTFSHPTDSDWGTGAQAQCPWGASCCKADPRHWRDHAHPPGLHAPPPRPGRVGGLPGIRQQRQRSATPDSGAASDDGNLIVTGKRARNPIPRQRWSGSEDEDDPYQTDESDEWEPPGDVTSSQSYSQSQDQ